MPDEYLDGLTAESRFRIWEREFESGMHALGTRGWAGFGGGGREGESLAETAAHKVEEESRGFYKRADIFAKLL